MRKLVAVLVILFVFTFSAVNAQQSVDFFGGTLTYATYEGIWAVSDSGNEKIIETQNLNKYWVCHTTYICLYYLTGSQSSFANDPMQLFYWDGQVSILVAQDNENGSIASVDVDAFNQRIVIERVNNEISNIYEVTNTITTPGEGSNSEVSVEIGTEETLIMGNAINPTISNENTFGFIDGRLETDGLSYQSFYETEFFTVFVHGRNWYEIVSGEGTAESCWDYVVYEDSGDIWKWDRDGSQIQLTQNPAQDYLPTCVTYWDQDKFFFVSNRDSEQLAPTEGIYQFVDVNLPASRVADTTMPMGAIIQMEWWYQSLP